MEAIHFRHPTLLVRMKRIPAPGTYFEEIGLMNQVESVWKLAIKLDVGTLEIWFQQLQDYVKQMEECCKTLTRKRPTDV